MPTPPTAAPKIAPVSRGEGGTTSAGTGPGIAPWYADIRDERRPEIPWPPLWPLVPFAIFGLTVGSIALLAALFIPPHAGLACSDLGCIGPYPASQFYDYAGLYAVVSLGMGLLALRGLLKGRRQRRRAAELARLRESTYSSFM